MTFQIQQSCVRLWHKHGQAALELQKNEGNRDLIRLHWLAHNHYRSAELAYIAKQNTKGNLYLTWAAKVEAKIKALK